LLTFAGFFIFSLIGMQFVGAFDWTYVQDSFSWSSDLSIELMIMRLEVSWWRFGTEN
jgi:hypothetical protein